MRARIAMPPTGEFGRRLGATRLDGREAVELYLARIDRNLDTIHVQVALLRAACMERKQLLREFFAHGRADAVRRRGD